MFINFALILGIFNAFFPSKLDNLLPIVAKNDNELCKSLASK